MRIKGKTIIQIIAFILSIIGIWSAINIFNNPNVAEGLKVLGAFIVAFSAVCLIGLIIVFISNIWDETYYINLKFRK